MLFCFLGNGQATRVFALYFKSVTGYDISQAQINEARKDNYLNNVDYEVNKNHILTHYY